MNIEHSYKLSELSKQYNVPMVDLFETYSKKQTQYLKRDLNNNKPINDFIKCDVYGNRALKVMESYLMRKK